MPYQTLNIYTDETHNWEPYIPKNADKLILGTFPTAEQNRGSYEFFYPNPNNDFWNLIFKVAGENLENFIDFEPIASRKNILGNLNLGIADIGKRILRQRGSSKDENLFPLEFENIFKLLEENKNLKTIIITSSSGGNSVLSWFYQYCVLNKKPFKLPRQKEKFPKKTFLDFNGKIIKIIIIPSPSRLSPIKGEELYRLYEIAIKE